MNSEIENFNRTEIRIERLNEYYIYHIPYGLSVCGIHRAVLEGDLYKVKLWIESRGSVNESQESHGFSALHLAVIKNDMNILEYLLSRGGIEVDARCSIGRTPLYLASALGWIESVKKLIQAGSDINISDKDNCLPLHMSVNHPDICHLLIRHGAPIDAVDERGRTPLDYAAKEDCVETIHMLLYYNADVNILDKNGGSCFITALGYGKVRAQAALLEHVSDFDMVYSNSIWFCSILICALHLDSPFVNDIIERGADVNYSEPALSDVSAFSMCLVKSVDPSTFKLIWEKLRYNEKTVDLLRLLDYPEVVPTYLQVIIESDNFEPAVQFFSEGENYFLFVDKFTEQKFDFDQLTALTCRLLENGFRASSYDVHVIFSHYGYCELFRILLYMDNNFSRGWLPQMALSRFIFNVDYDLESIVDEVNNIPKDAILQLLQYSICPRLVNALTFQYNDDESMSAVLERLPKVPLLIELARNAVRKQIWQAFKITNSCQFYTTVDHFDMPTVYKNILTFKRKIYTVT